MSALSMKRTGLLCSDLSQNSLVFYEIAIQYTVCMSYLIAVVTRLWKLLEINHRFYYSRLQNCLFSSFCPFLIYKKLIVETLVAICV